MSCCNSLFGAFYNGIVSSNNLIFRLWDGIDARTKKFYTREVFEQRVKELTEYKGDGNVDLSPVIEDYKDALFARWPLTRYQPMERYWKLRSIVTTFLPSRVSDWYYVLRHQ